MDLDEKKKALAREYEREPATGGVWIKARNGQRKVRDGAGGDNFDHPSKLVGRKPRYFKHLDADQFEHDREIVVVNWPKPGEPGSTHPKGWCDVVLDEFKPAPDASPPMSPSEVAIAAQRDEARREALEAAEAAESLGEELDRARREGANLTRALEEREGEIEDLRQRQADTEAQLEELRALVKAQAGAPPAPAPPAAPTPPAATEPARPKK